MTTTGQDWALQVAIVAAIKGDTEVKTLIGDPARVEQQVPATPTFPYLVVGEGQVVDDSVQGLGSQENYTDIHIWDNATTYSRVKQIEACLFRLLHDASLSLTGARCLLIQFDGARNAGAENPALKHRVVTYRAITEPAA